MVQPQRPSISIKDAYAQEPRELKLFDVVVQGPAANFLTASQLGDVFPSGVINRWAFQYRGRTYRIHRAVDRSSSRLLYLAVEEEDMDTAHEDSRGGFRRSLFTHPTFPGGSKRASPVASFSPWTVNDEDMLDAGSMDAYSPRSDVSSRSAGRSLSGPFTYTAPSDCGNKFARDMVAATSSLVPMERYKALVGLMSTLRREMLAAGLADVALPELWEAQQMSTLLRSIVMVGECLAKFGSTDFNEGSNSSRAITAKDYAALLRQYLQSYGFIFQEEFVAGTTDVILQDEMMSVSNLLQTRCEANDLIFGQLIKHVGLEGGKQGGGSTVYNSTVISANPNNSVNCNPTTTTTTNSSSTSQARLKSLTSGWGAVAMAGVAMVGLLLKGRRGGGGKKHQAEPRAPTSPPASSGLQRVMDSERLAVATLAACQQELERSRQNSELLENDWRLGKLRLSTPANPYPPGYKEVDPSKCDLQQFYQMLRNDQLQQQALLAQRHL